MYVQILIFVLSSPQQVIERSSPKAFLIFEHSNSIENLRTLRNIARKNPQESSSGDHEYVQEV